MTDARARTLRLWISGVLIVLWVVVGVRTATLGNWVITAVCAVMAVVNAVTIWRLTRPGNRVPRDRSSS